MKHSNIVTLVSFALALVACGGTTHGDNTKPPNAFAAQVTREGVNPVLAASDYSAVVQQLYVAYFGRPADTGGFASFKRQMAEIGAPNDIALLLAAYDRDPRVKSLIDSFGSSAESAALYRGDNTAFISAIYTNVLGRAPAVGGLAFWVGALDGGSSTRARASLDIMAGALSNKTEQGLVDAALVKLKVAVATHFTDKLTSAPVNGYSGGFAAARGRLMLSGLNASASATDYEGVIASNVSYLASAPSVPTWPLGSLLTNRQFQVSRTKYSVSGSCIGLVTDSNNITNGVVFDGVSRTEVTTTSSWLQSNCNPSAFDHIESNYFDSSRNLVGSAVATASNLSVNGTEFVSFDSPATLPANVRVGDAGTIGTATVYTNSAKQSVIGRRDYTYSVEADEDSALHAIANLTTRTINPAGQTLLTTQTKYKLSASIVPIAQDIQYATTSTVHLVKKGHPIFPVFTDTVLGNGAEATEGKVVTFNYTGWLYDPTVPNRRGLQFDTTTGRGPFSFTMGAGSVIQGWQDGLQGMKVGGKRTLILTSSLGYGSTGGGPLVPPYAALVFDVELISVK